jgi:hypothetical protein
VTPPRQSSVLVGLDAQGLRIGPSWADQRQRPAKFVFLTTPGAKARLKPPLRNRKEDIPMLVEYFVKCYAEKAGKQISQIDKNTLTLCQ